jgi:hypothetical protein
MNSLNGERFGRTTKRLAIVTTPAQIILLLARRGVAGEATTTPADTLQVTNPASKLLPQTQAPEESWLSGLHV